MTAPPLQSREQNARRGRGSRKCTRACSVCSCGPLLRRRLLQRSLCSGLQAARPAPWPPPLPPARRHGRCGRGRRGEAAAVRHEASQRGHRAGHRQPAPGEARRGGDGPRPRPARWAWARAGPAGWAPARTPPAAPGRWAWESACDLGQLPALSQSARLFSESGTGAEGLFVKAIQ